MKPEGEAFVPLAERREAYFSLRNKHHRQEDGSTQLEQWGEMIVPITSGVLEGYTAKIRLELVDGVIKQGPIVLDPGEARDLASANQVLRAVSLGDVMRDMERCLQNLTRKTSLDDAFAWLDAFMASRKRPGRPGKPALIWARVAARRVEAEMQQPGNAVRYMVRTWPEEFTSNESAWGKVNRAKDKGMLAYTDDGAPYLTDLAKELLEERV